MSRGFRLFSFLLIAAATGALSLWLQSLRQQLSFELGHTVGHVPDTRMQGVSILSFDQRGYPSHAITARSMTRFADDKTSELDSPVLQMYEGDTPSLKTTASRAWINADRDRIRLLGEVHIVQPRTGQRRGYTVVTRDMLVLPQTRTASTEQPVRAWGKGFRISGIGGNFDMKNNVLKIHSEVRSVYLPESLRTPPSPSQEGQG